MANVGALSSTVGLVTGFPIASTVAQLIKLESAPVTNLTAQNTTNTAKVTAVTQLEAQIIALQLSAKNLSQPSLYAQQSIASSAPSTLAAAINSTGNPPQSGNYLFTPLQLAQSQQLQSSPFASDTSTLGGGTFSFRFGGFVDQPLNLALTNGGAGVPSGKIQITDRSGATATIDLTAAQTIGDVIQAINGNTSIHVQAAAVGNHLTLSDQSGGSSSNLRVQEVGNGKTAAALGLATVNIAGPGATGQNIVSLFNNLPTTSLNDGNGVRFDAALPDVKLSLADGTQVNVTLHKQSVIGTFAVGTTSAANGVNAQLQFTAKQAGSADAGVTVTFVDNPSITKGSETVKFNAAAKTLIVNIQQGKSTANDVINAFNRDAGASAAFSAANVDGGDGTAHVTISDIALTTGPKSSATTAGTLDSNAKIAFAAKSGGGDFDNTQISFVNNAGVTAGHETVQYDLSNPSQPKLIFQIAASQTTAANIIDALNNNPTASAFFTAANAAGSSGAGLVSTSDGVSTTGGAIVEPIPQGSPTSLGDAINAINQAAPGKISAQISSDGQRLKLTDLTTGVATFSIADLNSSHAAEDLGLNAAASGGVITGSPLLGGLTSSLLKDLNGGAGLGTLGQLNISDRNGISASVDLSSAVTLDDVIGRINAAGIGVTANVNAARNGIQLTDSTGASASNFIVANGVDGTQTADKLGLTVNAAVTSKNGGDLALRSVGENTQLASLNGGGGVASGSFTITDTAGHSSKVNVGSTVKTIGDLIQAIENSGLAVQASVNSTGDGVLIADTAHGSGTLQVQEGSSTTASDLHILGAATTTTIAGLPTQVVNGATTFHVALSASDTLQTLINKINNLNAGVAASESNSGSLVNPFRLTLTGKNTGRASELQFDTSQTSFSLQQTAQAQDALVVAGTPGSGGFVASSSTNTFKNVLPGATLTVNAVSTSPVTLTVAASNTNLTTAIKTFVTTYNTLRTTISSDTSFNTTTNAGAVLQGDSGLLQVDTTLTKLISGQLFGVGGIQSLAALGVTAGQDGTLSLDTTQLQNQVATNPQGVQQFFSTSGLGFSDKLSGAADQLAGVNNSVLINRLNALNTTIANNKKRIDAINAKLTADQARLTAEFNNAEIVISKLQANQSALSAIQGFYTSSNSNNTSNSNSSSSTSSNTNASNGSLGSAFR